MGRYVASIKDNYVEFGDWSFEYVKQNQDKGYYENYSIDAELNNKSIKIPLLELMDIDLIKTKYKTRRNNKKTLHKWLFNYLKDKGEKIECYVAATLGTFNLNYEKPLIDNYYLQTKIGDENIVLSTEKKVHQINTYDEYEWIRLRLLQTKNIKK